MFKVVVNALWGRLNLSPKALELLSQRKGEIFKCTEDFERKYDRHDKDLVEVVELLGEKAGLNGSDPQAVQVHEDMYFISYHDESESVVTPKMLESKWIKYKEWGIKFWWNSLKLLYWKVLKSVV